MLLLTKRFAPESKRYSCPECCAEMSSMGSSRPAIATHSDRKSQEARWGPGRSSMQPGQPPQVTAKGGSRPQAAGETNPTAALNDAWQEAQSTIHELRLAIAQLAITEDEADFESLAKDIAPRLILIQQQSQRAAQLSAHVNAQLLQHQRRQEQELAAQRQRQGPATARPQQLQHRAPAEPPLPTMQRTIWRQQPGPAPQAGSAQVLRAAPAQPQTAQQVPEQRAAAGVQAHRAVPASRTGASMQAPQTAAAPQAAQAAAGGQAAVASLQPAARAVVQGQPAVGSGARLPPALGLPAEGMPVQGLPAEGMPVQGLPIGHVQPAYAAPPTDGYPGAPAVGRPAAEAAAGARPAPLQQQPQHHQQSQQQQQQQQQPSQQFSALERLRHPVVQQQALRHQVQRHMQQGEQPGPGGQAPRPPTATPQAGPLPPPQRTKEQQLRQALSGCSSAAERDAVLAKQGLTRFQAAEILGGQRLQQHTPL
ncbi:hypothetical protein ABPG75_009508 [Micractinium tetrahymenae]